MHLLVGVQKEVQTQLCPLPALSLATVSLRRKTAPASIYLALCALQISGFVLSSQYLCGVGTINNPILQMSNLKL